MNNKPARLYVVVPCYNEEAVLPETAKRLDAFLNGLISEGEIAPDSRVMWVDDGSRDRTWELIDALCDENERFEGLKLAHNAGHQNALWAGMTEAADKCDALVSIDADLQDDINAMRGFLKEYYAGADIVYGVRSKREKDTFFKRFTAEAFYKGMAKMGVETVFNHADYRLLSRRALNELLKYTEVNLFLRGAWCPRWASKPRRSTMSAASGWRAKASTRSGRCWPSPCRALRRSPSSPSAW